MDLLDRLATQLQRSLAANLLSLNTLEDLVAYYLSVDVKLRIITACEDKQKQSRGESSTLSALTATLPTLGATPWVSASCETCQPDQYSCFLASTYSPRLVIGYLLQVRKDGTLRCFLP
jgi:hypothetical protein